MKYFVFITFVLTCCFTFCQESDSVKMDYFTERSFSKGWISQNSVSALEYGISKYQFDELNTFLNSSVGSSFSKYLGTLVGSFSTCLLINRKFTMDSHLDFGIHQSMPIIIKQNDSSRFYLRGYYIGLDGCKDLLPKNQNADVLFGLGFNTGRFVFGNVDLTVDDKTNRKNRYFNPFFSPKLSLESRFLIFKHWSISFRSELQFDITRHNWKQSNDSLPFIGASASSGYNLRLTLGWRD